MGTKKRDLEIIYNLQWKNKAANGGDAANIVCMYDIPATTLNWDTFKSYLLKNSGAAENDVKVSYMTSKDREYPIESNQEFQIALYAFRRRARCGEVINLMLDRISVKPSTSESRKYRSSSTIDVETQSDGNDGAAAAAPSAVDNSIAPSWFVLHMAQFKKEILEEVTTLVSQVKTAETLLAPAPVASATYTRKLKVEPRRRKLPEQEVNNRKHLKTLKKELKLENKLEKLERTTKKIREKKMALVARPAESDVCGATGGEVKERKVEVYRLNGTPTDYQTNAPHMLGGEVYLHQWQVLNSGYTAWTEQTTLNFAWGSKALIPMEKSVGCPHLQPGDTGFIIVRLQVPREPGEYKSYWYLHHKGQRFGNWFGCRLIVDEFNHSSSPKFYGLPEMEDNKNYEEFDNYCPDPPIPENLSNCRFNITDEDIEQATSTPMKLNELVQTMSNVISELKIAEQTTDTYCTSDSDNQSIISISDTLSENSSKSFRDEFVLVSTPTCFKSAECVAQDTEEKEQTGKIDGNDVVEVGVKAEENSDTNNNQNSSSESISKVDEACSEASQKFDMVIVNLPKPNEDDAFEVISVRGQQVSVSKKYVDNLLSAPGSVATSNNEEVPVDLSPSARTSSAASSVEIVNFREEEPPEPIKQADDLMMCMSHCSATGSCFSDLNQPPTLHENKSRLFIFPQQRPGYEVVQTSCGNVAEVAKEENIGWTPPPMCYAASAPNLSFLKYCAYGPLDEPAATATSSSVPLQPQPQMPVEARNPFTTNSMPHVPNYQQSPPPPATPSQNLQQMQQSMENAEIYMNQQQIQLEERRSASENPPAPDNQQHGYILPDTLVSGAVNVASSAINTARSVINMIKPSQPGRWVNGHWVSANPETPREANLRALAEMGFWDRNLNATLLARYNDDLNRVVLELVQ